MSMRVKPSTLPFILLALILLSSLNIFIASSESDSDRVAELLNLQSNSKSGVIHLNDQTLNHFLISPKGRSYSLLIFFDAVQLHDKQELHLKDLKSEFDLVSSSFISKNKNTPDQSKLFFCDIEFKESQNSFSLFGVNTLPHIRLVNPQIKNLRNSDQMDQNDLSRMAESMAEFVESKTKLTVGSIERPPIVSTKQLGFLILVLLMLSPFLVKKILEGNTLLHEPILWVTSSVFIYFFSVSGAMFNIIRKMPMFLSDRNDPTKIVYFHQGSGMQLGAEGFTIGFLYTIVGLLLAFATHLLVRVRNKNLQRGFMAFGLIVSFWAVKKVVYLDNWKTGYGIHGYWPSSWN